MGPFAPPPPPGAQPPPLWGSEEHLRGLFGDRVDFRTLERDVLEITAFERPHDYGEHFKAALRPDHRRPRERGPERARGGVRRGAGRGSATSGTAARRTRALRAGVPARRRHAGIAHRAAASLGSAACSLTQRRRRAETWVSARAAGGPCCSSTRALMPYHRLIVLVVLGQPRGALVPPRPRRLADRRRQRTVGARGPDARELHGRRADPPAARPQRAVRPGGARIASWPLWIRWSVSKVHHVGGIHAGGALAGTAWLCAFTVRATVARSRAPESVSLTTVVLAYGLAALALLVVVCALPAVQEPRPQRVRAQPPVRRLDGDRAVLGPDLGPRRDRLELAGLGAGAADREHRLAVAAAAAGAGHGRAPVLARRDRPLRLRGHARDRVGRRDQPQPAPRMAHVRDGQDPRPAGIPAARLPRRRLDRPVHRRSAVAPVGPGHRRRRRRWPRSRSSTSASSTSSPAAGSDRASGRSWPAASRRGSCGPCAARAPPTATTSSTRSRRRSPTR